MSPTATDPGPIWDRLTYESRRQLAREMTTRLLSVRDQLRDAEADLRSATSRLHTTRARADLLYRHIIQLQKDKGALERKNEKLRGQIAERQRALADLHSPLAEATAERMGKRG